MRIETLDDFVAYAKRTTDYEQKLPPRYREEVFDLGRVRQLMSVLGDPQRAAPAVHIAGSKGKGSVARLTESIALGHRCRVGMFTSPHLESLVERVRIDGAPIAEGAFCDAANRLIDAERAHQLSPTFFELCFALACVCFADAGVQLAIHEVGLGGRLDATNVLEPAACAITAIDLDHTRLLGDTLPAIAREKAGILKPGVPAVLAPGDPGATAAVLDHAALVGAPAFLVGRDLHATRRPPAHAREQLTYQGGPLSGDYALAALGAHQVTNAAVALGLAEQLTAVGACDLASPTHAAAGLATCQPPCRVQPFGGTRLHPRLILDTAHTIRSGQALAETLEAHYPDRSIHAVVAFLEKKRARDIVSPIAPRLASLRVTESATSTRARPADDAADDLADWQPRVVPSAEQALTEALSSPESDLVVVTGSFYLAGQLLPAIRARLDPAS